jgi:hypothetical protein
MSGNTMRYEPEDDRATAAVYWRRRFLALLAGLAILGIVGWACLGAIGGGGATGNNAADVGHVTHSHASGAAAADAQASAGSSPGSASVSPAPSATAVKSPAPVAGATTRPSASPAAPPPCSAGDVVISVFATQASYDQDEPPAFNVDVVSTSAGTCTFNVGPRYLSLVVTAGARRVWGSADCAARPGSLVADLVRGVPTILPVSWDLQTSSAGCPATAARAAAGTYRATASDGDVTSSPVTFTVD